MFRNIDILKNAYFVKIEVTFASINLDFGKRFLDFGKIIFKLLLCYVKRGRNCKQNHFRILIKVVFDFGEAMTEWEYDKGAVCEISP